MNEALIECARPAHSPGQVKSNTAAAAVDRGMSRLAKDPAFIHSISPTA